MNCLLKAEQLHFQLEETKIDQRLEALLVAQLEPITVLSRLLPVLIQVLGKAKALEMMWLLMNILVMTLACQLKVELNLDPLNESSYAKGT